MEPEQEELDLPDIEEDLLDPDQALVDGVRNEVAKKYPSVKRDILVCTIVWLMLQSTNWSFLLRCAAWRILLRSA